MTIFLTGVSGFIGRGLYEKLLDLNDCSVIGGTRFKTLDSGFAFVEYGNVNADTSWLKLLYNCKVVIHAAGVAHISQYSVDTSKLFARVNVDGTLNLARQAASSGVERFIFISSIGVNGNQNHIPFTAEDVAAPQEPYAQSKYEAEVGLLALAKETGMEIVIIRPPLVYGPDAPGNFGKLVRLVEKGIPLPLGAIHNKRSFVALDNLVDLIVTCIDHPAAANQVFLAGDGEDLSTSELLRGIATAMGKPSRLLPVPESWLRFGANLLGKEEVVDRLLGSLQVDISKTRDMLGWTPPISVEEGLKRCFAKE
ncbi:SDR family oxidoreductase [Amphritea opalescens]|uniref:SDR family oxidoreductase n=1 Tax=Amphritea opalescens TaxID=2490544 RepID=A0A430KTJ3_9GAMM|nr:SDR family oxidoreductase [Amphritea opalescens]RTE66807.1 SDR family oxidoreductase [Amphritea opalescens]